MHQWCYSVVDLDLSQILYGWSLYDFYVRQTACSSGNYSRSSPVCRSLIATYSSFALTPSGFMKHHASMRHHRWMTICQLHSRSLRSSRISSDMSARGLPYHGSTCSKNPCLQMNPSILNDFHHPFWTLSVTVSDQCFPQILDECLAEINRGNMCLFDETQEWSVSLTSCSLKTVEFLILYKSEKFLLNLSFHRHSEIQVILLQPFYNLKVFFYILAPSLHPRLSKWALSDH